MNLDQDPPADGRVAQGIVQQVGEKLGDQVGHDVGRDRPVEGGQLEIDIPRQRLVCIGRPDVFGNRDEIAFDEVHVAAVLGIDPPEREQLLHDARRSARWPG